MRRELRLFAIILASALAAAQGVSSQGPASTPPPAQSTGQSTSGTPHRTAHARHYKTRHISHRTAQRRHAKIRPPAAKAPQSQEDITVPLSGKNPALHRASVVLQPQQPVLAARQSLASVAAAGFATLALGLLGRPNRAFQRVRDRVSDRRE
jgi:hypothetical protein